MSSATGTLCHHLFNKEAKELYPAQDSAFIDQSLETVIKVVDHLVLSCPEALFLFDPASCSNQCHIYSFIVARAMDKTTRIDPRFLYLSFFLSHAFAADSKLLSQLVCKTLSVMQMPVPSKDLKSFLLDSQGVRKRAARQALNNLFAQHMRETLVLGEGPLYSELSAIANTDLQLTASDGKGTLYTFPKFAGVAYLIDVIFKERVALLFKVKVLTKEGSAVFTHSNHAMQALAPATPVIVFEMVATGEGLIYPQCRDIAVRCPSHSYRNVSSKNRHPLAESCLFCTPQRVDAGVYQQRFEPILQQTNALLLALGADFVRQEQTPFLEQFFKNPCEFPHLTALFEASVLKIEECCLSMKEPLNMTVSHVYTDCASQASQNILVMDADYETHLTRRGLT